MYSVFLPKKMKTEGQVQEFSWWSGPPDDEPLISGQSPEDDPFFPLLIAETSEEL